MILNGYRTPVSARSLGDDCVKEHGVNAIPDVMSYTLKQETGEVMIVMACAKQIAVYRAGRSPVLFQQIKRENT